MKLTSPHPVDVHVGRRIRAQRKYLGMSQQDLGAAIGVTMQQIQKYESGSNRISASMLFLAAEALKAPIAFFFADVEGAAPAEPPIKPATHS